MDQETSRPIRSRPFWKSPTPYLVVFCLILVTLLGLAGWQAWSTRLVHDQVARLRAFDLSPLTTPPPVTLEELIPFRRDPGNAAEDLLPVLNRVIGRSIRRPVVTSPHEVSTALWKAAKKGRCDWFAPGGLEVKFPWPERITPTSIRYLESTLSAEAQKFFAQGNLGEAEKRYLMLISLGAHFSHHRMIGAYWNGVFMQRSGSRELPGLYARMGDPKRRDLAQVFHDDLERRILTLQKLGRGLEGDDPSAILLRTAEGVAALEWLIGRGLSEDIYKWDCIVYISHYWAINPLEVVFGPAAFRKKTVQALVQSGDPLDRQFGQLALEYLDQCQTKGVIRRLQMYSER